MTLLTVLGFAASLAASPADLPARAAPVAVAEPETAATTPPATATAAPTGTAAPTNAAPLPGASVPDLRLPRSGVDAGTLLAPLLLLAGLGGAAWVLRRRRRPAGRRVEVLETTSLGPKRALVLARFEGELLLLGASESGIQLLRHRTSPDAEAETGDAETDLSELTTPPVREPPAALADLVTRLRGVRPTPRQARGDRSHGASQFDALLTESAEDQELRRKLARGQGGNVR